MSSSGDAQLDSQPQPEECVCAGHAGRHSPRNLPDTEVRKKHHVRNLHPEQSCVIDRLTHEVRELSVDAKTTQGVTSCDDCRPKNGQLSTTYRSSPSKGPQMQQIYPDHTLKNPPLSSEHLPQNAPVHEDPSIFASTAPTSSVACAAAAFPHTHSSFFCAPCLARASSSELSAQTPLHTPPHPRTYTPAHTPLHTPLHTPTHTSCNAPPPPSVASPLLMPSPLLASSRSPSPSLAPPPPSTPAPALPASPSKLLASTSSPSSSSAPGHCPPRCPTGAGGAKGEGAEADDYDSSDGRDGGIGTACDVVVCAGPVQQCVPHLAHVHCHYELATAASQRPCTTPSSGPAQLASVPGHAPAPTPSPTLYQPAVLTVAQMHQQAHLRVLVPRNHSEEKFEDEDEDEEEDYYSDEDEDFFDGSATLGAHVLPYAAAHGEDNGAEYVEYGQTYGDNQGYGYEYKYECGSQHIYNAEQNHSEIYTYGSDHRYSYGYGYGEYTYDPRFTGLSFADGDRKHDTRSRHQRQQQQQQQHRSHQRQPHHTTAPRRAVAHDHDHTRGLSRGSPKAQVERGAGRGQSRGSSRNAVYPLPDAPSKPPVPMPGQLMVAGRLPVGMLSNGFPHTHTPTPATASITVIESESETRPRTRMVAVTVANSPVPAVNRLICDFFIRFGLGETTHACLKTGSCPYHHPLPIAPNGLHSLTICADFFLRGLCERGETCHLLHPTGRVAYYTAVKFRMIAGCLPPETPTKGLSRPSPPTVFLSANSVALSACAAPISAHSPTHPPTHTTTHTDMHAARNVSAHPAARPAAHPVPAPASAPAPAHAPVPAASMATATRATPRDTDSSTATVDAFAAAVVPVSAPAPARAATSACASSAGAIGATSNVVSTSAPLPPAPMAVTTKAAVVAPAPVTGSGSTAAKDDAPALSSIPPSTLSPDLSPDLCPDSSTPAAPASSRRTPRHIPADDSACVESPTPASTLATSVPVDVPADDSVASADMASHVPRRRRNRGRRARLRFQQFQLMQQQKLEQQQPRQQHQQQKQQQQKQQHQQLQQAQPQYDPTSASSATIAVQPAPSGYTSTDSAYAYGGYAAPHAHVYVQPQPPPAPALGPYAHPYAYVSPPHALPHAATHAAAQTAGGYPQPGTQQAYAYAVPSAHSQSATYSHPPVYASADHVQATYTQTRGGLMQACVAPAGYPPTGYVHDGHVHPPCTYLNSVGTYGPMAVPGPPQGTQTRSRKARRGHATSLPVHLFQSGPLTQSSAHAPSPPIASGAPPHAPAHVYSNANMQVYTHTSSAVVASTQQPSHNPDTNQRRPRFNSRRQRGPPAKHAQLDGQHYAQQQPQQGMYAHVAQHVYGTGASAAPAQQQVQAQPGYDGYYSHYNHGANQSYPGQSAQPSHGHQGNRRGPSRTQHSQASQQRHSARMATSHPTPSQVRYSSGHYLQLQEGSLDVEPAGAQHGVLPVHIATHSISASSPSTHTPCHHTDSPPTGTYAASNIGAYADSSPSSSPLIPSASRPTPPSPIRPSPHSTTAIVTAAIPAVGAGNALD